MNRNCRPLAAPDKQAKEKTSQYLLLGTSTNDRDGIEWNWQFKEIGSSFYNTAVAMLLRHTRPGSHILEIGVGCGFVLCEIGRRLHCQCIGVDIVPSAIEATSRLCHLWGVKTELVLTSGFALPFPDECFDMVYSLGVIEHFPNERSLAMLREHARVCRHRGRVLVAAPNGLDIVHTLNRARQGRKYPYHPERSYTPWALRRLMRNVGLEPDAADGFAPLWSWQQTQFLYLLTASLFKLGLLERLERMSQPRLLSLIGNLTAQVATKTSRR